MARFGQVILILAVLAVMFLGTLWTLKYIVVVELYDYYSSSVMNLTGWSTHLVRALVLVGLVPFLYAIKLIFSLKTRWRLVGRAILMSYAVGYNLFLFAAMRNVNFAFSGNDGPLRWVALTPDGPVYFDRQGRDPVYGIEARPVTREIARNLKKLSQGAFNPVDPAVAVIA